MMQTKTAADAVAEFLETPEGIAAYLETCGEVLVSAASSEVLMATFSEPRAEGILVSIWVT